MNQLKEAFNSGNIPVATRYAHSLKSSAANIGATDLSERTRLIEHSFRAENLDNVYALISEIDYDILCVLEALK